METPTLKFYRYFANGGGSTALDDTLTVKLSDGSTTVVLEKLTGNQNSWVLDSFKVSDYFMPTSTMWIEFEAGDYGDGHLVEAAIDLFQVVDTMPLTESLEPLLAREIRVFPNPFQKDLSVEFHLRKPVSGTLEMINMVGENIYSTSFEGNSGTNRIDLRPSWKLPAGVYFLRITTPQGQQVKKILRR